MSLPRRDRGSGANSVNRAPRHERCRKIRPRLSCPRKSPASARSLHPV